MASARWASLILLVALAGTRAQAETSPPGPLRATAVWGDDRFVSGGTSQTALSSDGRRVAVTTTGGVIVWDVTGGPEVRIPMPTTTWRIDRPTSMTWAPDGRMLFVGSARGLIRRLEVAP